MRLLAVPFVLAACSVVPVDRGPTPLEALEARVAALEADASPPCRTGPVARGGFAGLPRERHGSSAREHSHRQERHTSEATPRSKQHFVRFDGTFDDLTTVDLAGLGRALLHRDADGDFDGYRLSGIRDASLGGRLGLRNGDIVHTVNGHPVRSLTEAVRALEAIQGAERLDLELTRRGEPVDLRIAFTP